MTGRGGFPIFGRETGSFTAAINSGQSTTSVSFSGTYVDGLGAAGIYIVTANDAIGAAVSGYNTDANGHIVGMDVTTYNASSDNATVEWGFYGETV